jgi:hypothetical protein
VQHEYAGTIMIVTRSFHKGKGLRITMPRKPTNPSPKDPAAAKRTAALKERLQAEGGKRMSLNLDGKRVKTLDRLVKRGVGADHSAVIRQLIDDAE